MRRIALSKGFPAATVDEVCEMAGVTKGSFYHHFASKDELGLAAVESYFDDVVATFGSGDWTGVDDPVARLRAFIAHAADVCIGPVMVYGCLIGSMTLDMAESAPELRERLSQMFAALRDVVAGLVAGAAVATDRAAEVDPAQFGDQFLAILEGSIILAKAHGDTMVPRRGLVLLGDHLDLLLR